jgi:hypothetical protein
MGWPFFGNTHIVVALTNFAIAILRVLAIYGMDAEAPVYWYFQWLSRKPLAGLIGLPKPLKGNLGNHFIFLASLIVDTAVNV